jgi:hypothetical protein
MAHSDLHPATRRSETDLLVVLGRLLHWGALAVAAAAVAMAVVWSDHGEGGGYATPLAVLAAVVSVLVGRALRRLLARE